jgi:hypothetical protein
MSSPQGYSLNLEESLVFGLFDRDEASRQLAIEEIAAGAITPTLETALQKAQAGDPSAKCRERIAQILTLNQKRAEIIRNLSTLELSPGGLSVLVEGANEVFWEAILKSCNRPPGPQLLDAWRHFLLDAPSGKVAGIGFHLLARFGTPEDSSFALRAFSSESPESFSGAIALLEAHAPDLIKTQMENIFALGDLSIVLKGIRALVRTDPQLALSFLEEHLESPQPLVRQKALRELLLIPFEDSMAILTRFLGREDKPLLMVIAGLVFAINPHPVLPLKLYDLLFVSRGIKRQILEELVRQTVQSLHQAQILNQPIEDYISSLKREIEKRKAAWQRKLAAENARNADPEIQRLAQEQLRSVPARPEKPLPVDKETKEKSPATAEADSPSAVSPATICPESFAKLEKPAQIGLLNRIRKEQLFSSLRPVLLAILKSPLPKPVLCELIALFGGEGIKEDAIVLDEIMKRGDSAILCAGIRALSLLDPDALQLQVNRYLQSEDPFIKVAALEFYLGADKESGLGILRSMLTSPAPKMRQTALSLIPRLDFPTAEPLLISMFRNEAISDLRNQAGFLLVADLTWDGLFAVYEIASRQPPGTDASLDEIWKTAREVAVPLLAPDAIKLEEKLSARLKKTQEISQEIARIKRRKAAAEKAAAAEPESLFPLSFKVAFGTLAVGITLFFLSPGKAPPPRAPVKPTAPKRAAPFFSVNRPALPAARPETPRNSGQLLRGMRNQRFPQGNR